MKGHLDLDLFSWSTCAIKIRELSPPYYLRISIYLSIYLSILDCSYVSVVLFIYLSVFLCFSLSLSIYIYIYMAIFGPVHCDFNIHRLHLRRRVILPTSSTDEYPRYDTKQSIGEALVKLDLWGMQNNPLLPSFPAQL